MMRGFDEKKVVAQVRIARQQGQVRQQITNSMRETATIPYGRDAALTLNQLACTANASFPVLYGRLIEMIFTGSRICFDHNENGELIVFQPETPEEYEDFFATTLHFVVNACGRCPTSVPNVICNMAMS